MTLRVEENESRLLAEIDFGGRSETYECLVRMCDNPVCTCNVVHMALVPEAPETGKGRQSPRRFFSIKLREKTLLWKDEAAVAEADKEFAELFLSSLDDDDYAILYEGLFHYKNRLTEEASPASIDITFDYDEIENGGLMVNYNDLLPYGDLFVFDLDGKKLVACDEYCVSPHCPCSHIFLHLFDPARSGKLEEAICILSLEYRTKEWALADDSPPADVKAIRSALDEQFPDFYRRLRRRHKKIKAIYAHSRKKYMTPAGTVPRITAEPPIQSKPARSRGQEKVGRNDPCPCGSGKKYKKCCRTQ